LAICGKLQGTDPTCRENKSWRYKCGFMYTALAAGAVRKEDLRTNIYTAFTSTALMCSRTLPGNQRNYIPRGVYFGRSRARAFAEHHEKGNGYGVAASDPPLLSGCARNMTLRKPSFTTSSCESRFKLKVRPYRRASSNNNVTSARLKRAEGDMQDKKPEKQIGLKMRIKGNQLEPTTPFADNSMLKRQVPLNCEESFL
jgi:hypothetical protein